MRAAVYEKLGPRPDVLRIVDIDRPEPGPGEVRVRIELSGGEPDRLEVTQRARRRGPSTASRCRITTAPASSTRSATASTRAGSASASGPGWPPRAAGGAPRRSGAVVPSRQAVALPDGASAELGACLGVPAMTAHRCLFADGPVDGKNVLVAGGAGAVGHFAIELAKFGGARVAATVSGPEKAELARQAGADLVVNYRDAGAAEQLREFAPQMDRIVELALGANLELDLALSGPQTVHRGLRGRAGRSGNAGAQVHERERRAAVHAAVPRPGAGPGSGRGRHQPRRCGRRAVGPAGHQVPARQVVRRSRRSRPAPSARSWWSPDPRAA